MKNFRFLPMLAFFILSTVNGLYAQIRIYSGTVASMGDSAIVDINLNFDATKCYTPVKKEHVRFESTTTSFSFAPDSIYYNSSTKRLNLIIRDVPRVDGLYEISFQKETGCKVLVEDFFQVKPITFSYIDTYAYNNSIGDIDNFYRNNSYRTTINFSQKINSRFCQSLTKSDIVLSQTTGGRIISLDSMTFANGQVVLYYKIPKDAAIGKYDLIFWSGTSCVAKVRQFTVRDNWINTYQYDFIKGTGRSINFYYYGPQSFPLFCENIDLNKCVLKHKKSGKEIPAQATDYPSSKSVNVKLDIPYNAEYGEYEIVFKNSCLSPIKGMNLSKSQISSNATLLPARTNTIYIGDSRDSKISKNCISNKRENFSMLLKNGGKIIADSLKIDSDVFRAYFFIPTRYAADSVYLMIKDSLGCYDSEIAAKIKMNSYDLGYEGKTPATTSYYNDQKVAGRLVGNSISDTCLNLKKENFYFSNGTDKINIDSIKLSVTGTSVYDIFYKVPSNIKSGSYNLNIDMAAKTCNGWISTNSSIYIANPRIDRDSVFITLSSPAQVSLHINNSSFFDPTSCQYNWGKTFKVINVQNNSEFIPDSIRVLSGLIVIYFTPDKDFAYGEYQVKVSDNCGFPIEKKFTINKARYKMDRVYGTQGTYLNAAISSNQNSDFRWKGFIESNFAFVHEMGNYSFSTSGLVS
ncbi:MAG: hypothetical protein J7604_22785, partial [Sporocytophaga sp.]|uniref:hypothetical protein n=1 Tax=Sporocytophaga sp. TaxID=2231183 RepID=UPI001B08CCB2